MRWTYAVFALDLYGVSQIADAAAAAADGLHCDGRSLAVASGTTARQSRSRLFAS